MSRRFLAIVVALCAIGIGRDAAAQTGENILLVANSAVPASGELADYYARKRQVPAGQILRLTLPTTEEIARPVFETQIEAPIANWLATNSAQDHILYIVLVKGVPLRVSGTVGQSGTVASVDSELTLLYRKLSGRSAPIAGSVPNPYFIGDAPITQAKRFTHEFQDIYLVGRLDGFTVPDVKAMIDRGAAPSRQGVIVLDGRSEWTKSPGNTWLERAAEVLKQMDGWADRVVLDTGSRVAREQQNVLGYYSWGSNDTANLLRHWQLGFVPGAIGGLFVSTDARTFVEPPDSWQVHGSRFAGTNQSLVGDLIRDGITGVSGQVAEPYLGGTVRPNGLFPAYVSGYNLIESFYLSMPYLSWQTVVIGDPLCAPFMERPLTTHEIDRGTDPVTELPFFLSERRVSALTAEGAKLQAAKLYVKGEVRLRRNDRAGARQSLEEATALDESIIAAQLVLATLYEGDSQWDAAIDRYRRVVARVPNQAVALNNLAYALAVRRNRPEEALPLAKRAYTASRGSPPIADTLGWIQHLLGNDAEAERLISAAAAAAPDAPEIQLHAAIVLAATGKTQSAAIALARAIKLNAALEQSEEVRRLRERLGPPKP